MAVSQCRNFPRKNVKINVKIFIRCPNFGNSQFAFLCHGHSFEQISFKDIPCPYISLRLAELRKAESVVLVSLAPWQLRSFQCPNSQVITVYKSMQSHSSMESSSFTFLLWLYNGTTWSLRCRPFAMDSFVAGLASPLPRIAVPSSSDCPNWRDRNIRHCEKRYNMLNSAGRSIRWRDNGSFYCIAACFPCCPCMGLGAESWLMSSWRWPWP